jgi:hypothetical protein
MPHAAAFAFAFPAALGQNLNSTIRVFHLGAQNCQSRFGGSFEKINDAKVDG